MTDYTLRCTIVCPADLMADANQLALALGESASDDETFMRAAWRDAAGNTYAVSSTVATGAFPDKASTGLVAPDHAPGVDLTAAGRAQAALYIYGQHGTGTAAPDRLWVLIEPQPGNARAALAVAGVERIPPININTADADTLQSLSGVGPVIAQAIIDGREWADPADLAQIDGISADMVAGWRVAPGLVV